MHKQYPSQEELLRKLHYDYNTGVFTWKSTKSKSLINKNAGYVDPRTGYRYISLSRKKFLAHRLAWYYVYGTLPKNQIDHINHDTSDNRIINLRDVTNQQNGMNATKPITNTSGIVGVAWRSSKNKFRAVITFNQKHIHLGYYKNIEDAIIARKAAEVKYGFHKNHGVML